jgi:TfoX/Sxy family transcriptional regulator of competence genes
MRRRTYRAQNEGVKVAYDHDLAERIRAHVANQAGQTEKEMFGGIGFFIYGNMACGVIGDELVVRVGPAKYQQALDAAATRPFDITGRPMKGWITVETDGLVSDQNLASWVEKGVEFAGSLPRKS